MSVRFAILGLLAQHPRHGYDLHATLLSVVGGQVNWDLKPAQVYTTLARLEKSGWVAQKGINQESGPEKRIFQITPTGRQVLEEWFKQGVRADNLRDEFFIKLMIGLSLKHPDPLQMIKIQRNTLSKELHAVTAQRQDADPKHDLARILMLDKTVMHLEADLRWLDMIEGRLEEVQRQPMLQVKIRPRGRPPGKSPSDKELSLL